MIVVCSGEGVSDLGTCVNQCGACSGDDFRLGPLSIVLDGVIQECLEYSPREVHPATYRYYGEAELVVRAQERKNQRRGFSFAGRKRGVETGYFYINAWTLGEIAKELEAQEGDVSVAVLFRDSDGTNTAPRDLWSKKVTSMVEGFRRAEFSRGIPMVPRPKSESWFLCLAKDNPYQHCEALEELPGNDKSPNSAKQALADCLGENATAEKLLEWIELNGIDQHALAQQMSSFAEFYNRAKEVFLALKH
ncbi:hypothetical protein A1354_00970 [Pseudomonas asplenii]|jgi:hypothetical protein|nr:hypothetical protein [Pseudomonas asplenii]PNG45453.1 hypothetical protein A1354_00970 [Pseudomonas asplenii]